MTCSGNPLPRKFYLNEDVLQISKNLLGKYLLTHIEGIITGGIIIETEAYRGPEDRASHAYGGRRTKRNEVMYHEGGVAYVYLCYGIHAMFNVVTNFKGVPHAILIRALKPVEGIEKMKTRREKTGSTVSTSRLTAGPGTLCQALGIKTIHNGVLLTGNTIWVEDRGVVLKDSDIAVGPRVGIDYAGEDALLPWRFQLKNISE